MSKDAEETPQNLRGDAATPNATLDSNTLQAQPYAKSKEGVRPDNLNHLGTNYPFTAIVGQNDLKLALTLLAVQPKLGGVLIRGDKGSAKSTTARGLASLLPARAGGGKAPFVNLPLGAAEDRVLGTLDLEKAMKGERKLQPGLLAAAHGGVLYIDEVNLLPDHLVDVLLDVAASGVNRVQREGLSVEHQADFALIGTMNPEEGKVRPQLLDRFGLCVDVTTPEHIEERVEIVRRRMSFEYNAVVFQKGFAKAEHQLTMRISEAQTTLHSVHVSEAMLGRIAQLCYESGAKSLRADLVLYRAALALAALAGRDEVSTEHIERVAPFVLVHRSTGTKQRPPKNSPPAQSPRQEDRINQPDKLETTSQAANNNPHQNHHQQLSDVDRNASEDKETNELQRFGIATLGFLDPLQFLGAETGHTSDTIGNHVVSETRQKVERGRVTRTVLTPAPKQLAVSSTITHALARGVRGSLTLTPDDLHGYERETLDKCRVLVVVDSSGSLGVRQRMATVKGVVATLLADVYSKRDEIGLVSFRGKEADFALAWTKESDAALAVLEALPTGGRTPLAHALELVQHIADDNTEILLFTDGKANVALNAGGDAWRDALEMAAHIKEKNILVVDTEEGFVRVGRARELASALNASYASLQDLVDTGAVSVLRNRDE